MRPLPYLLAALAALVALAGVVVGSNAARPPLPRPLVLLPLPLPPLPPVPLPLSLTVVTAPLALPSPLVPPLIFVPNHPRPPSKRVAKENEQEERDCREGAAE